MLNEKWEDLGLNCTMEVYGRVLLPKKLIKLKHEFNIKSYVIVARKLIGDQYIPSGQNSWKVHLGVDKNSPKYLNDNEILLSKKKKRKDSLVLKGKGQIADYDFKKIKMVYGELTILNDRDII